MPNDHLDKSGLAERDDILHEKDEEGMETSEAEYKTIFNAVNDAIFIHDPDTGEILEVNRSMTQMFGYTVDEARRLAMKDISSGRSPYTEGEAVKRIREAVRQGGSLFEWHVRDKTGRLFWVEVNLKPTAINGKLRVVAVVRDITKRKQAEEAQRKSEERFRAFMAASSDVVYCMSPDWREMRNLKGREFIRDTEDPGSTWIEKYIHPDDQPHVLEVIDEAIRTKSVFELEHRVVRIDGTVGWIYSRAVPLLDADGEIIEWMGTAKDITSRKQAEEELKRTNDRFRVLTQNLSSGVALIDELGRFSIVNTAFLRIFELSEESDIMNVNNRNWAEWQVFDENGKLLDVDEHPVRKAALTGKAVRNRLVGVRGPSDSEIKWLLISAEPIFKKDGRLDVTICTYLDITQRKLAEEALKDERARLAATLESMPDEVWIADKDMHITQVNRAVKKDFDENVNIGQQIGEIAVQYEVYHADGTPRLPEEAPPLRALRGETVRDEEEIVRIPSTGGLRHRMVTASPVKDPQGDIIGSVSVVRDVTEQKRAEADLHRYRQDLEMLVQERTAELERKNEKLEKEMAEREKAEARLAQAQKMEAIGALAGGIAHDLKNILTPILINTEIALEDVGKHHPAYPVLEEALDAAKLGRDLVQQILTFSRRAPREKIRVNIPAVIRETVGFLRSTLPATIDIRNDLEDECVIAYADPTQIKQVLINLGTNAGQAMREQGGTLDVSESKMFLNEDEAARISPDLAPGPYIQVEVQDTGQGMDEDTMEHIFEPFFTTKKGEGTGMGLAVAHGIVKEHQGAITVRSKPGEGALFTVLLPMLQDDSEGEVCVSLQGRG